MKKTSRFFAVSAAILTAFGALQNGAFAADDQPTLAEKYRPFVYAELPDDMFGPDALCWNEATRTLYLTVPNFAFGNENLPKAGPCLVKLNEDGSVEKLLDFPQTEGFAPTGSMGIDFGPDGNLYVCDNQYFSDPNYKSRLLRVVFADGKPTGEVQTVVEGFKVANAVFWDGERVFVTDTILDEPGKYGSGGVYMFSKTEILDAGTSAEKPAIRLAKTNDPRLILVADAEDVRGNNCGADGITKDESGVYYFGNYGDGAMWRFRFDENGKATMKQICKAGEFCRSVDGICFDPKTDKVYITDSAENAIWACSTPDWDAPVEFELIWENDDTDGADGSLDLPCECRVVDGLLLVVNQDVGVAPTGKNLTVDKPYTVSAIKVGDDRAFTSPLDGTEQRYLEILPPNFRRDKPCDVLFFLHGHGSDRTQIFADRAETSRTLAKAAAENAILVSPDYRAKTSWLGPAAEDDVVRIIERLKREYQIDRVIFCGGSMGGTSVLTFAALRPELVDGVISFNGLANHVEYANFQDAISESFGGSKTEVPEEYKKRSAEFFPERFAGIPVAFCLGGKDDLVPADSARRLAAELTKRDSKNVLEIYRPDGGHATNDADCDAALDFVFERAKSKNDK